MIFTEWCCRPRNILGNLLTTHKRSAGSRDIRVNMNILCLRIGFAPLHNIFSATRAAVVSDGGGSRRGLQQAHEPTPPRRHARTPFGAACVSRNRRRCPRSTGGCRRIWRGRQTAAGAASNQPAPLLWSSTPCPNTTRKGWATSRWVG